MRTANDRSRQPSLLVIGPEPPPTTGMELATQALLAELRRASVPYQRVNTADPSDELGNRGRWTLHNVGLSLRHLASAVRKTFTRDVAAVYVPIAQEFPALFRDLAFVSASILARKPVVIHLHGGSFQTFYDSRRPPVRRVIRGILGRAEAGIVLAEGLRPALECVLPAGKVVVVQNGLDLPEGTSREPAQNSAAVTALFLSSLFPTKGVLVFIRAVALARERGGNIRGIVAGPWPTREAEEEGRALVETLGLHDAVDFTGPVAGAAKTRLLHSADIFCFPSFYPLEGQPLVVIEAMAAGLPVVATAWRGIGETVVDGETGFLVSTAAPELVAEKLAYLAANPEVRTRMGAAGRAEYERHYTQRAFGERMIRVLRPLLKKTDHSITAPAEEALR